MVKNKYIQLFLKKNISYNKLDLVHLIEMCFEKNQNAQREIVTRYYGYVHSICRLYSNKNEEVEEMVNDSFLKMFNSILQFDTSREFLPWLRSITVNCCIDYYRKYKSGASIISLDQALEIDIEEEAVSKLTSEEIEQLIENLPDSCRIVFLLFVIEGLGHKEIAEKLGIQEGTSKSNLRDARLKLKKKIQENYKNVFHYSQAINTI